VGAGGAVRGPRSRVCVAIDDPILRRRVHSSLIGVASETFDIDSIAEPNTLRRDGAEPLLIILGPRVGGVDLTPASVHRVRAAQPLVPIIISLTPRHPLQRRLSELALAGADRVLTLDAPDQEADLRNDVREALRHILPPTVELGVDGSLLTRTVSVELYCARNGYLPLKVQMLADRFDIGRGSILKAAKSGGWRDAESLIRASRVLHEALELERSSAGATMMAESLHFGTASAVHNHLKRATGRTIRQLRLEGALKVAAEMWRKRNLP
jgi:hypothetical protein